jgi:hypothetical protein
MGMSRGPCGIDGCGSFGDLDVSGRPKGLVLAGFIGSLLPAVCCGDVPGLRCLVPAAEKHDERGSALYEVHAIAGTDIDAEFAYAYWLDVSRIAECERRFWLLPGRLGVLSAS